MSPQASLESENKALLRRWFDEVWNHGRDEAIEELRTPDATATGLAETLAKLDEAAQFRSFVTNMRAALPDLHVSIEDMLAEEDKVAVRLVVDGTHTGRGFGVEPTGKRVQFGCITIARVANGKIVEGWNNLDQLGLLTQLGAIPRHAGPDRFLASQS